MVYNMLHVESLLFQYLIRMRRLKLKSRCVLLVQSKRDA